MAAISGPFNSTHSLPTVFTTVPTAMQGPRRNWPYAYVRNFPQTARVRINTRTRHVRADAPTRRRDRETTESRARRKRRQATDVTPGPQNRTSNKPHHSQSGEAKK